jgi:pimeloyl-ACP methyl ester carboxylesterase
MKQSTWKVYTRYDFTVEGRDGLVIAPPSAAAGRPWIWRAEYFDIYSQVDMVMLERGWHLAYLDVSHMYGCPESIRLMRAFQRLVQGELNLAERAILFGFSIGGIYSFNFAAEYPQQVSALYLDAPALDTKVIAIGEPEPRNCMKVYGLTPETVMDFKGSPIDKIEQVANANIPIIMVQGDADTAAVYAKHGEVLYRRYTELGGEIRLIMKPGAGHHPHSLENPLPIVEYLIAKSLK